MTRHHIRDSSRNTGTSYVWALAWALTWFAISGHPTPAEAQEPGVLKLCQRDPGYVGYTTFKLHDPPGPNITHLAQPATAACFEYPSRDPIANIRLDYLDHSGSLARVIVRLNGYYYGYELVDFVPENGMDIVFTSFTTITGEVVKFADVRTQAGN
jgi:hypothetical protein